MKILAIEDEPIAAAKLRATLGALGYQTEMASDGAAGWERLKSGAHRIVVSDWRMPGIDGLELCRRVRQLPGDYVYFILVSSTKVSQESREAAVAAGVDDFLSKPIDTEELGMRLHVAERIIRFSARVQQLESILPICAYCKKIRDDGQYWKSVEDYLSQHQGTQFSHGVCPTCYDAVLAPQLRQLGIDPDEIK